MIRLMIDGWSQDLKFSASHFIPGHEKCGRLHGHTYAVSAIIEGTQDKKGIVVDFVIFKETLRKICNRFDHMVILPKKSDLMNITEKKKSVIVNSDNKKYQFPIEDVILIDVKVPSAEELAKYILKSLLYELKPPQSVSAIEICVEEGKGQGAWARETI